ncbi:MAG: haloalkane dehalogenase [Acidimicrobiales bacterium]|jgi:haloalkane dehalogenase
MEVLRTPDERFEGLRDYGFDPRYREVVADDGTPLRFHFVDEGPQDAAPVLLLHGNPTWCYLYRHMIPELAARGHRVVALDLMGMGRSDKPVDPDEYTLARHVDWMGQWLVAEDLDRITLFCQDWGGTAGLNLLPVHGERFARVIASNTGLPAGRGMNAFMEGWLAFSQSVDQLPVGGLLQSGTSRTLSPDELLAYEAPFPDGSYQASPKRFPLLIPLQPDNPGVAQAKSTWAYLERWEKPFLTVFGDEDAVAYKAGAQSQFVERIPGARALDHVVLHGPNHFIQEDAPDELVEIIDGFVRSSSTTG